MPKFTAAVQAEMDRLAYSPDETARLLGMSRAGVYNLLRAGTLPSVAVGRRRLIRREDIDALLRGDAA